MNRFEDKVVLITGGSRGIGKACAKSFVDKGASVILCGRNAEALQQAEAALGDSCHGIMCDVSVKGEVIRLVEEVVHAYGGLHILVNNAGITDDGLLPRMRSRQWENIIAVNLNGAFYTCRAAAKTMLRQRFGRIINIGSIIGLRGQAGQCNYAAAKAGLIGFTKAYAREVASRNITVNLVAPGLIETDMTADMGETALEMAVKQIPLGRTGTPEDVASVVTFLASEDADYITGAVLPVDGGLAM